MPTVIDFMEGKVFINYRGAEGGGFSSVYRQDTTDYALANTQLALIITERAKLLPYNWHVVHATNSRKRAINDSSLPALTTLSGILLAAEVALATDAECSDKQIGLLCEWDTGAGKMVSSLLRAIRDDWVEDNLCVLADFSIETPFTPGVTIAGDVYELAIENYLNTRAYYTRHFDPVDDTNPQQYEVMPWTAVRYKRVGNRDMGRGFSTRSGRRKARI